MNLRAAVVAEAVDKGIASLSVGGVVHRAKVSAGTVYVHFESKDDMLQKIYMEIKAEFHRIMTAARTEPSSALMIRRMWFDMFDFAAAKPNDFLFLELGNAAQFLTPEQAQIAAAQYDEIGEMLMQGVQDGTLFDLDAPTVSLLLVAPAMQLARAAATKKVPVPTDAREKIFSRVWRSIANDGVAAP